MIVRAIYEFKCDFSQTILSFHFQVMLRRKRHLSADEILQPGFDTSFEVESLFESCFLVDEIEGDARRKICGLLHSRNLDRLGKFYGLEYHWIWLEFYRSSYLIAFTDFLDFTIRDSSLISLEIFLSIFIDRHFQPFT